MQKGKQTRRLAARTGGSSAGAGASQLAGSVDAEPGRGGGPQVPTQAGFLEEGARALSPGR